MCQLARGSRVVFAMPVCDVCGEDEYYEEDGQFYCTVCNTQSQVNIVYFDCMFVFPLGLLQW